VTFSFGKKLERIAVEVMSSSNTQCNMSHPIIIIIIITENELSLGGSSPYASKEKINMNKYT
jgi:hypothetical protein